MRSSGANSNSILHQYVSAHASAQEAEAGDAQPVHSGIRLEVLTPTPASERIIVYLGAASELFHGKKKA